MDVNINPNAPKPSDLLQSVLDLLGPNGQNWTKGVLREPKVNIPLLRRLFGMNYCMMGALNEVNTANQEAATTYLAVACGELYEGCGIIFVNDREKATFDEVVHVINYAIELAKADGN